MAVLSVFMLKYHVRFRIWGLRLLRGFENGLEQTVRGWKLRSNRAWCGDVLRGCVGVRSVSQASARIEVIFLEPQDIWTARGYKAIELGVAMC